MLIDASSIAVFLAVPADVFVGEAAGRIVQQIAVLPEFKSEAQQFELSAFVEEHFVRCPVS